MWTKESTDFDSVKNNSLRDNAINPFANYRILRDLELLLRGMKAMLTNLLIVF